MRFSCLVSLWLLLAPAPAVAQPAAPGRSEPEETAPPSATTRQSESAASPAQPDEATASHAPEPLEVVVVGRRRPATGTTVRLLRRAEIDRGGATTVAQAVELLPTASASSGARGERIVSLRGFDQRQVMVMIDSVPVSMPYDGQLDLHKLPLGLVDHVTVVQGSGSLLYGPNGLGGAINIATREPGRGPALVVSTEASPLSSLRASTVGSGRIGPVGALVGASLENTLYSPMSSGFVPTWNEDGERRNNSDRRVGSLMAKLRWDVDDAHALVGTASHLDGRFGVPPGVYDLTPRYWRWSDWRVDTVALAHSWRAARTALDETAYLSLLGNTLDSFDDAHYRTQRLPVSFTSSYADTSVGLSARASHEIPWTADRVEGATLRAWLGARRDAHGGDASAAGSALEVDTVILTGALQAEATFLDRMAALGGIQIDGELPGEGHDGTSPEPGLGVGPMGSLSAEPCDGLRVTASVAERTRFPTLRERFSAAFGARAPNPGLEPERATNLAFDAALELGEQGSLALEEGPDRSGRVELGLGLFDSEVRDLIIPVIVGPQTEQLQNGGRVRLAGAEIRAEAAATPWLSVGAGWAWLYARRLDLAPPADRVPYRPEQKAFLALTVQPFSFASITAAVRWIGPQEFQNPDTAAWGRLGSASFIDARVEARPVDGLSIWVRSSNLTDANVQTRFSYPEPGRQLFVGVSARVPARAGAH